MGYTLLYNHPHFPEGTPFHINGLDGTVPNGGTVEIDEDMERFYIASQGVTLEDGFKGDHAVSLSGSSALDKNEVDQMLAAFAPVQEEEVTPVEEEQPSWMNTGEGGEPDA